MSFNISLNAAAPPVRVGGPGCACPRAARPRLAAELSNQVQRQRTVFFWESDSGSPPGPTVPTPQTPESEGCPLGPLEQHGPDFTCPSAPLLSLTRQGVVS